MLRLDRSKFVDPLEVTLTYPKDWRDWCPTGKAAKLHLYQLAHRWEYRYGYPAWVWKLEFQRRGAPHFMILVDRPGERTEFEAWLHTAWSEVVTAGSDAKHRQEGVHVDSVHSWQAFAGWYFGGYLTRSKGYQEKPPEGFTPGRWWQITPSLLRPWTVSGELSRAATKLAVRQVRKAVARRGKPRRSRRPSRALWTSQEASQTAGPLIYWAQLEELDHDRSTTARQR